MKISSSVGELKQRQSFPWWTRLNSVELTSQSQVGEPPLFNWSDVVTLCCYTCCSTFVSDGKCFNNHNLLMYAEYLDSLRSSHQSSAALKTCSKKRGLNCTIEYTHFLPTIQFRNSAIPPRPHPLGTKFHVFWFPLLSNVNSKEL